MSKRHRSKRITVPNWYGPFLLFLGLLSLLLHQSVYIAVGLTVLGALFTVFDSLTDPI